MTTATRTPFVEHGGRVAVVENCDLDSFYVRFEDGSRRWISRTACTLDVEQPDWYEAPDLRDVPGVVR